MPGLKRELKIFLAGSVRVMGIGVFILKTFGRVGGLEEGEWWMCRREAGDCIA